MTKILCNRVWCTFNEGEGTYKCMLTSVTLREDEETREFECDDFQGKEEAKTDAG